MDGTRITNIGIIYNLHHGHGHLDRLEKVLPRMLPHLLFLNLNGMDIGGEAKGRKILPLGVGTEDVKLLRLAGLPFAQETGAASARVRRLHATDMERALVAQGRQLRQALEVAARQVPFAWAFEVVRGELLDIALAQSGADMLVLGCTRRPGYAGAGARQPARPHAPALLGARRIMVVYDDSAAAMRALEAAHALAGMARSALVVLVRGSNAEGVAALRAQASAWLAGRGAVKASFVSPRERDIASVARESRTQEAAAVLLPAPEGAPEAAHLAELVDEIACPVVLVR